MHADEDKQGLVQGMITGMRGLCNGLGPAMFGLIFSLFHVDLNEPPPNVEVTPKPTVVNASLGEMAEIDLVTHIVPGPPFVFGALLVILALMVSAFIPEKFSDGLMRSNSQEDPQQMMLGSVGRSRQYRVSSTSSEPRKNSLHDLYKKSDDEDLSDKDYTVPLIHTTAQFNETTSS